MSTSFTVLCRSEIRPTSSDLVTAAASFHAAATVEDTYGPAQHDFEVTPGRRRTWKSWSAFVAYDHTAGVEVEVFWDGGERMAVEEVLERHPRVPERIRNRLWETRFSVEVTPRGADPPGYDTFWTTLLDWIADAYDGMLHTDQGELFLEGSLISESHPL